MREIVLELLRQYKTIKTECNAYTYPNIYLYMRPHLRLLAAIIATPEYIVILKNLQTIRIDINNPNSIPYFHETITQLLKNDSDLHGNIYTKKEA